MERLPGRRLKRKDLSITLQLCMTAQAGLQGVSYPVWLKSSGTRADRSSPGKRPNVETGGKRAPTDPAALVEDTNHHELHDGIDETTALEQILNEHHAVEASNAIEEDALEARENFAQEETVRDLLQENADPIVEVDAELDTRTDCTTDLKDHPMIAEGRVAIDGAEAAYNLVVEPTPASESKVDDPLEGKAEGTTAYMIENVKAEKVGPMQVIESVVEANVETPVPTAKKGNLTPASRIKILSPQEPQSPQIGTTLLRRESLRSKSSPRKKGSAQKSKTPQKRQGLKKRDTLQEREILQQFNAAVSPHQKLIADNPENLAHHDGNTSPSKHSPTSNKIIAENPPSTNIFCNDSNDEPAAEVGTISQSENAVSTEDVIAGNNLVEAIEVIQQSPDSDEEMGKSAVNDVSLTLVAKQIVDGADDSLAGSEAEGAARCTPKSGEKTDLPIRKTRSGTRISDDTSVLKDFLNRAQAKKAAKNPPTLSAEVTPLPGSPTRRSPRKALKPHSADLSSSQKCSRPRRGPSTPPRKAAVEEIESSDENETGQEATAFRRSTRTRLPAPTKTPPGVPSFIPVRRGDGSDQVVLQKSHAQETAIVTRANTRRNKGQSKPPALALQHLPANSPVKMTAKERADRAKTVVWAEQLASYCEVKDAPDEPDEQRPKVRRIKGLGPVNGTPAKKSTVTGPCSNGTPAPKRRSKTR